MLRRLMNLVIVIILSPEAQFRAGIPGEGTPLWKLAQSLMTGLEFRIRYKLDHKIAMQYEHVNAAAEVEEVLRCFFSDIESKAFGLGRSLCLYCFFKCTHPTLKYAASICGNVSSTRITNHLLKTNFACSLGLVQ